MSYVLSIIHLLTSTLSIFSHSADGVEGNDAGYHQSIDVPASRPSTSISSHRTSKGVEDRVGELVTASLASVGCLLPVEEGLTTSTKAPRHRAGSSAAVDSLDMTAEVDVNALLAKQKSEKVWIQCCMCELSR